MVLMAFDLESYLRSTSDYLAEFVLVVHSVVNSYLVVEVVVALTVEMACFAYLADSKLIRIFDLSNCYSQIVTTY